MKHKLLIVTAHPDDETLWFSSVILRESADVVCVTCGVRTKTTTRREGELKEACSLLGVQNLYTFYFQDLCDKRLDINALEDELRILKKNNNYNIVYTHGPFGDTNENCHHQDICYAVHKVFNNVKSIAWNIYPDIINNLSEEEFYLKKYIMGTIYHKEYRKLKTTYELSTVEKFIGLTRESVEIFYWAIANFNDHHQKLGSLYTDIWGYNDSPYEIERHLAIKELVEISDVKKILEIGAHEGVLTDILADGSRGVDCVEKALVYQQILKMKGYNILGKYDTTHYDLTLISSVLEYMDDPINFLKSIESNYILVEVIMNKNMLRVINSLRNKYRIVKSAEILPRWENMYHGGKKEKMEVYKLGAIIYLMKKI